MGLHLRLTENFREERGVIQVAMGVPVRLRATMIMVVSNHRDLLKYQVRSDRGQTDRPKANSGWVFSNLNRPTGIVCRLPCCVTRLLTACDAASTENIKQSQVNQKAIQLLGS